MSTWRPTLARPPPLIKSNDTTTDKTVLSIAGGRDFQAILGGPSLCASVDYGRSRLLIAVRLRNSTVRAFLLYF